MKLFIKPNLFLLALLCFLCNTTVFSQFDKSWTLRLDNKYKEEQTILLSQNGNSITGKLNDGGKISGTWDEKNNKLTGFFRMNRKLHKFSGHFKNKRKKEMIIAKYCACSGEPDRPMIMTAQKLQGWANWRKAQETYRKQNSPKTTTQESTLRQSGLSTSSSAPAGTKNDYSGRYRITITNLYTATRDDGPIAIFDNQSEIFGSIGIRMRGESKSGTVEIKSAGNKQPRVWSVSERNPVKVSQNLSASFKKKDVSGRTFDAKGTYEIDKARDYKIEGELANDQLLLNIQMHLTDKDRYKNDVFGWCQRSLYVKDIIPNKEYLLESKEVNGGRVAIGFTLEKIN